MKKVYEQTMLPEDAIVSKIYYIRGKKVMMDRDLAELYGVDTKVLKRQVKRNRMRFPDDFMFEMTHEELENWRCQFGTSNSDIMGLRYAPFCFTEQGVAMLSCILHSQQAIEVNIKIIRVFVKMREMLTTHKDILYKLEQLEQNDAEHDKKIQLIFEYLKQLEQSKQEGTDFKQRKRIGFKITK